MSNYSTREAAQKAGLSLSTLNKYIALNVIPLPPLTRVGGVRVRLWTEADIKRIRKLLPKIKNGRKTRYQKKKGKGPKPQPRATVPHEQRHKKKK